MEVLKTERPLAAGVGGELNGTLTIHSVLPLEEHQTKEGIFSFVLYYHRRDTLFTNSLYYKGILSYLECIKPTGRFKNWSVVVYTDKASVEALQVAFPFETYSMLVLCIVDWPAFTDSEGLPSPEMLRCLRFQSVELFPTQICCIRDADTLFQTALNLCYGGPKQISEFSKALEQWEKEFVDTWLKNVLIQKPIVIGMDLNYYKPWHSNFPAPVPWRIEAYSMNLSNRNSREIVNQSISSPYGMFAGFVNFGANKSTFQDLWSHCIRYLGERYSMVRGGFENEYKRIISNKHSQRVSGGIVGKDEKILIFCIARIYFDQCFFFPIQYNSENSGGFFKPGGYIAKAFTQNEHKQKYGYSPLRFENENVQYHVIPPVTVCGFKSGMLNPAYIQFVLTGEKTSITPKKFTVETMTHSIPEKFRYIMAEFYKQYEIWISTIDISTFLENMKRLEKAYFIKLKTPKSIGFENISYHNIYNRNLNLPAKLKNLFEKIPQANINRLAASEDLDDMFLQQVGPYTPAEEDEFKRRLDAERQVIIDAQKEKERERLARLEEEQKLRNKHWGNYRYKGGVHRKTRKHRRFTKKTRNVATRKRSWAAQY